MPRSQLELGTPIGKIGRRRRAWEVNDQRSKERAALQRKGAQPQWRESIHKSRASRSRFLLYETRSGGLQLPVALLFGSPHFVDAMCAREARFTAWPCPAILCVVLLARAEEQSRDLAANCAHYGAAQILASAPLAGGRGHWQTGRGPCLYGRQGADPHGDPAASFTASSSSWSWPSSSWPSCSSSQGLHMPSASERRHPRWQWRGGKRYRGPGGVNRGVALERS